jgi:RND family efflux transporter MFP subunit
MNRTVVMLLKIALPVVVLAIGVLIAIQLAGLQQPPANVAVQAPPPLVRIVTVSLEEHRFSVRSQGTVRPRTESRVIPEVAGRVVWVSPNFVSGAFFEADEPLLRIDSHNYEQAVIRASSEIAAARLRLAQEEAEAEVARAEWEELGEGEVPPDLTVRVPQLENARASVAAAEANLVKAQRDLERTEVTAPYAGRVRDKVVDIGQFVGPSSQLGTIYAIDVAEIRLPLPDPDLAFLDNLPLVYRGQRSGRGPEVILRAEFAGRTHEWQGRLVRTEGEIDAASRMVHAVAQVTDPYGRGPDPGRPPLAVGMWVTAEILGSAIDGVAVVPRAALRGETQVWILDAEDRLRIRDVEVLRLAGSSMVIGGGLADGERVIVSALDFVSEGMRARPQEDAS